MNTAKTKPIEHDEITGEVLDTSVPALSDTSMVGTLARAEIDMQIATAKRYPRDIRKVRDRMLSLATLDEQSAAECMYAMPRGGKPIRGPSIRLGEIGAQSYQNNRVDARVIDIDRINKVVVAEGTFLDLETNAAVRAVVQRKISDKRGRLFSDDMIVVTGNAACSIARRNAIFAGIPKAIWRPAYEACEKVVAGDIKTLGERREKAIKAFATYGVKPEQIFASLEVKGIDEITLDHIPELLGMFSALKNGEATVEEMFDPRRSAGARAFDVVSNPLKDEPEQPTSPAGGTAPAASDDVGGEGGEQGSASGASESAAREATADPAAADETAEHLAIVTAYKAGQSAKSNGHKRTALPGELRDPKRSKQAIAWTSGWDGEQMPFT